MPHRTEIALLGTGTLVLLDVPDKHLYDFLETLVEIVGQKMDLPDPYRREIERALLAHADGGPDTLEHGTAVVHECLMEPGPPIQVLARFTEPMDYEDDEGEPCRYLWVLLSNAETHPHAATAAEFCHLMAEPEFRERMAAAENVDDIEAVYSAGLDDELHFHPHVAELEPTGRLFGGLRADIQRRLPHYLSDFTDGLDPKTPASVIFLFFACLAPSVAFGGLLSVMTEGQIGVVETMVATSITGVIYALVGGQPLSLLGSTGPVTVFIGILYGATVALGIPYLPTLAWVGMWTSLFLMLIVAFDLTSLIRFFTRFTDETFAALISLIFIYAAMTDIAGVVVSEEYGASTALLSLVISLGTYLVATNLASIRSSTWLRRPLREFLADFGPAIALFTMTGFAWLFFNEVSVPTLAVPETFGTTSGRAWLVDPFEAPRWVWFASALPAVLGALLLYLDQNITVRLVNNPSHRLEKGAGYHLDLGVVAVLTGVFSLFGLPWTVAATVRSLNHVRSLEKTEHVPGHGDRLVGVVETRVSALLVHLLIGGSLLALPLLGHVPMSSLFGLFLYMGVASMRGNQFFERARLWATDPAMYSPTHYLRAVPTSVVHRYTLIQAVCLAALWAVKESPFGLLFPLFIAVLVPVRMWMERLFKPEHLVLLDAAEAPDTGVSPDPP